MKKLGCLFISLCIYSLSCVQANDYKKLDSLMHQIQNVEDSNTLTQIYTLGKSGWNTKDIILLKKAGAILEEFANTSNNRELEAKANLCNGMAFSLSHQYEKAFLYLFSSLRICERYNLFDIGVSVNNIIAYNYFNIKNYKKAIYYAQKSINFLNKSSLGKSVYYVDSYRIIGEAYLQLNNSDLGKMYYLKSLDYAIRDKDSQGIQYIYYSIANLYLNENKVDSAINFINKASFITQTIHDSSFYQYIYQQLASIALKKKNYTECLQYITKAFRINAQFKDLALKVDIMNLLTTFYKERKDYHNAFLHSQIANQLSDSLHSIEVDKKVIELEALFESAKATAKINELSNVNQLNMFRIKTEQREKNALLAGLFISLLAIIIIGYVLIQKNRIALKLNKINAEKTEMMGILSHDLRSPITKIHALNSVLIQEPKLAKHHDTFNRINDIIKEAIELIQNLLDVSTLEKQTNKLYVEQVDLLDELLLLKEEYAQMAHRKGIEVHLEIESNDIVITTDRLKLKRILDNLLSNALKYSPIKSNVNIRVSDLNEQVYISFSDLGIGLDTQEQKAVFKKFPNLPIKPTMGESATGMGLFITKQLVTMLNGEIEILSLKFEGTTFIVKLPKNYCKEV